VIPSKVIGEGKKLLRKAYFPSNIAIIAIPP